jgi:pyrimidine operon attenuation protein/uracil phosphoribosyltransferase
MNAGEKVLCDNHDIAGLIDAMARELSEARRPNVPLYLVGVRTRGVPLALRLAHELRKLGPSEIGVGAVDITLYRDDLGRTERWPVLRGTDIPFDVDGAEVVVVDDVLFTGRTVRAALNAICDLGRPACIRLAVLIDRGHREIPVQPDVVGRAVATNLADHVRVRLQPADPTDEVVQIAGRPGSPRIEG